MRSVFYLIVASIAALSCVTASRNSNVARPPSFLPRSLTKKSTDSSVLATDIMFKLRGGDQAATMVAMAGDWVGSLAGPASIISGAVLSNLYQNMRADAELSVQPGDTALIRTAKKLTKFLLTSAFAMVISCIFFSLITRSMLMALPPAALAKIKVHEQSTPMSVLRENFEFEYLTCQLLIGQGLLNWLASIALTFGIPRANQPVSVRKMNQFISSVVFCMMLVMISFFNNHLIHYPNYLAMLMRWMHIMFRRFIWHYPLLPMAYIIGPIFALTVYRGLDVFLFNSDSEEGFATKLWNDVFG
jgi:hypothetical protein